MSSTAGIGATVRRDSPLRNRVLSALVLAAVTLGLLWLGGRFWQVFVVLAAAVMAWEWAALCAVDPSAPAPRAHLSRVRAPGFVAIFTIVGAVVATSFSGPAVGIWVLLGGGVASALLAWTSTRDHVKLPFIPMSGRRRTHWYGLGVFYVGLPCVAILWIREESNGFWALLWLLALVWATDTGAYIAGRRFGGPKLAPQLSPNKTWSGLLGGVAAAILVGVAGALLGGSAPIGWMMLLAGCLAVIAQAGDLLESAIKRRANVKDVSGLIPGHGGMLDRVDGLMLVTLAAAALQLLSGQDTLTWS